MKKADYKIIAETYDQSRSIAEENIKMWLDPVSEECTKNAKLADLGCGTGRFAIPLAYKYGFQVTGIDKSEAMLTVARKKDILNKICWEIRDLEYVNKKKGKYNVLFMSHLLHHITNKKTFLSGCYNLLFDGGKIFIRHGAMDQIEDDVEHTFFPGALEIDRKRTLYTDQLETLLKAAGFLTIYTIKMKQNTYKDPMDHYARISLKCTSVLTLISENEFAAGLKRLKTYIEENPGDPWLIHDEMTLTVGYKGNN